MFMQVMKHRRLILSLTGGNKSFYLPGVPVKYAVTVTDKNDTSTIDPANLFVSVDYVEGFDKAASLPWASAGTGKHNRQKYYAFTRL